MNEASKPKKNPLLAMVADQERGEPVGFYSICSANPFVLEAAMQQARADGTELLIECTSNQVDQFGGYTGMTPKQFVGYVKEIAGQMRLPFSRVILGGDHLGPNAWQNEDVEAAMHKARDLIAAYVEAGYSKIHIDTSMCCAGDPTDADDALPPELSADRAARLCQAAEDAHARAGRSDALYYVIGTEVPPPGGAVASLARGVRPTRVKDALRTMELTRKAFLRRELGDAWNRIIAVVVQPGVEYGDAEVVPYNRAKARHLSRLFGRYPGVVYEAHSTDYQTETSLRRMVEDHFAVLKVGPWLTFALREALFALAQMERELVPPRRRARLAETLEAVMARHPRHWQKYYHGSPAEQQYARKYSFSDRSRYYWPEPRLQRAVQRLLRNLRDRPTPLTLLSQFMPGQYAAVRDRRLGTDPAELLRHKVREVTAAYARACGMARH